MSDDTFPSDGFDDGTDHDDHDHDGTGHDDDGGGDRAPDADRELADDNDLDVNDLDDNDLDDDEHDDTGPDTEHSDTGPDEPAPDRPDSGGADREPGASADADIVLTTDEALADGADGSPYPDDLVGTLDELGVDRAEFVDTMHLLGLDQAADGRSIVITLERLGVDAHLEFTDVDRLASHLAGGAEIRLSSGHVLTGLDDVTDEAVLERDGTTSRMALEVLEDAWTDHGFESVVTRNDARTFVLLPVTADPRSGGMSG